MSVLLLIFDNMFQWIQAIHRQWKALHPTTRSIMLARAFRSLGQGALVVDLTLYLKALQWSGVSYWLGIKFSRYDGCFT